jgi:NAD(P)-dependent dehydrogenase (short-subunit alcohol dehydrogenase family)
MSPNNGSALSGAGALVTGGAGGLGSAIAQRLASDGAAVTVMGRTEASLRESTQRIHDAIGDAVPVDYFVGDAKRERDVMGAVAQAGRRQPLEVAVSVVGGGAMAPLLLFDPDTFTSDLENNALPAFLVMRHAIPPLSDAGGGSIVCISSDAAAIPFKFMAPYCAGKAALDALVRVAALEYGHLGIRINSVRPGLVRTNSANSQALFAKHDVIKSFVDEKPLGRTGLPEDVAAVVRFLAGPEASWVTGQSWAVEGGNELTKAPSLEALVRDRWGVEHTDQALGGHIPEELLERIVRPPAAGDRH